MSHRLDLPILGRHQTESRRRAIRDHLGKKRVQPCNALRQWTGLRDMSGHVGVDSLGEKLSMYAIHCTNVACRALIPKSCFKVDVTATLLGNAVKPVMQRLPKTRSKCVIRFALYESTKCCSSHTYDGQNTCFPFFFPFFVLFSLAEQPSRQRLSTRRKMTSFLTAILVSVEPVEEKNELFK